MHGAVLKLSNGDRLTGELTGRADGILYFHSNLLGDLVIAEAEATVVDAPETPIESLSGLPPEIKTESLRDSESRRPVLDWRGTQPWKGKLEFGYNSQEGRNSSLNYVARGVAERTIKADGYRLSARYLYGEAKQVVSSDRRDASFRWRHQITERVFGQTLTSYAADQIAGVDLNLEQNAGFGYMLLRRDRQTASVGTGLTVQYRESDGVEKGIAYLGEIFQDYSYKLNGHLTFQQSLNALYSPDARARSFSAKLPAFQFDEQAENYKVQLQGTLQGKLSERISLNLRYEYEYDNAILDISSRTDKRITSSLGYSF